MTEIEAKNSGEISVEEFKDLARKVLPNLEAIGQALFEAGVKPDDLASIAVSGDGYLSFNVCDSNWSLLKLNSDAAAKVRLEYSEVLDL